MKDISTVGDHGQRYEVRFDDGKGVQRTMGWAQGSIGVTRMANSVNLHPVWDAPVVYDRQQDNKIVLIGEILKAEAEEEKRERERQDAGL